MTWSRSADWAAAQRELWVPFPAPAGSGVTAGYARSVGPLTHLVVHGAGHFVPMDQASARSALILRLWL